MDLRDVLAQLIKERDALDAAISKLKSLERARRSPESVPRLVNKTASNGTNPVYRTPSSTAEEQ
jgi:hypothetical protein